LCGYAQPQSIIVSDSVQRAIGGNPRLAFLEERQVDVRGVSGAVTIYRLVAK
jgi:class 3 adenylate cyclase